MVRWIAYVALVSGWALAQENTGALSALPETAVPGNTAALNVLPEAAVPENMAALPADAAAAQASAPEPAKEEEKPQLKLNMAAVSAMKMGDGEAVIPAELKSYEKVLRRFPFNCFKAEAHTSAGLTPGEEKKIPIVGNYSLYVKIAGMDQQGGQAAMPFRVTQPKDLIGGEEDVIRAEAMVAPGKPIVLRGLELNAKELMVIMSFAQGDGDQKNQDQQQQDQQQQEQQQQEQKQEDQKDQQQEEQQQQQAQEQQEGEGEQQAPPEAKDKQQVQAILQSLEEADRREQKENRREERKEIKIPKGGWW